MDKVEVTMKTTTFLSQTMSNASQKRSLMTWIKRQKEYLSRIKKK